MLVKISEDQKTAILTKANGRKNKYEIIQSFMGYNVYVQRRHHNSRWSERWLLMQCKHPLRIIYNSLAPMLIEFEIIKDNKDLENNDEKN